MKTKYFRDNIEISADQALDAKGIVRDGITVRTHVMLQDGGRFSFDDNGQVLLDGKPYLVPLQLDDDCVARPTLDKKRKKVLGPTRADEEETERTESDAAPEQLLADGSTVISHRPHFGVVDRATLEKLDAIRVTCDHLDSERWKNGNRNSPDPIQHTDVAPAQSVEDCYRQYDEEMAAAHRKVR